MGEEEEMREVLFYFFGILTVAFAIISVTSKNIVRGGISLLISFFLLGAIYFTSGAEFIGVVQVIVYGGAIVVLYLFALMTMEIRKFKSEKFKLPYIAVGGFISLALLFFILFSALEVSNLKVKELISGGHELSHPLFFKFLLPFEVVSVLLLVATIGAVSIGRREE
ncbi:MAG: NADH-quinone oxidoreductase subunit J [Thermovibrio sp.]|nr:MAG: NADH-quinone oxidoreductase subunit J [Thermovibrio sp.]